VHGRDRRSNVVGERFHAGDSNERWIVDQEMGSIFRGVDGGEHRRRDESFGNADERRRLVFIRGYYRR